MMENVLTPVALTIAQLDELRDFICRSLAATGQNVSRFDISISLVKFGEQYSLPAMCRFMTWMQSHGYSNEDILCTIVHDLNGRDEDPSCFSPRTSSY